jgi:hypothetical protein
MPEDRRREPPKGGTPGDRLVVRRDAHRELEFRYDREERLERRRPVPFSGAGPTGCCC